ncbi:CHASE3 domain-containing protein [Streptomyces sp. KR80]
MSGRKRAGAGSKRGLTHRMATACALVALCVGLAFGALIWAITELRESTELTRHTQTELVEVGRLEQLIIDAETGLRGFVITRQEEFLEPWEAARKAYPEQSRVLLGLADDPGESERLQRLVRAGESYIQDYSVPLVDAARRNDPSVQSVAATEDGRQRIDAIRDQYQRYTEDERSYLSANQHAADDSARWAIIGATAGLAGSVILILAFAGYLTRAIVQPVRRAAVAATQLADGDLAVRMPEVSVGEVGELERTFNFMGSSLQDSRDELRRIAEEQAALRRVATLVARGGSPAEAFSAVADEMGRILRAQYTTIGRYEPDGTMTVVGSWSSHSAPAMPLGSQWELADDSAAALVARTQGPARVDHYEKDGGEISRWAREQQIDTSIGCPVVVEARLWGVVVASWVAPEQQREGMQERMRDFTELIATAIANAESRAELTASRARIVAAADETRHRIERDLHDGTQQHLVSLGLELRAVETATPPELNELREQLARTSRGLAGVVEDLQELSRGLHPAVLSKGGLGPALKMLARRSALPVELDVRTTRRLTERVEVTAYYIVSEALTNAAKHAEASVVHVGVEQEDGVLRLEVRDDGVGGADPAQGSGLIGLRDRVDVLGGTMEVVSPPGVGTRLLVTIPIDND